MILFAVALAMLQPAVAPPPPPPAHSRRPHSSVPLSSLFSWHDYPVDALHRGSEGLVGFRVEIDPAGRVVNCTVIASSSDNDLDRATCAVLVARGRYEPARDTAGRAVAGFDSGRVVWRLPLEEERDAFTPSRYVNRLHTDASGTIDCTVTLDDAPAQNGAESSCELFADTGAADEMRQLHAEAALTIVYALTPEGTTPLPGDESGFGERLSERESWITVATDGRITDCRTLRNETRPVAAQLMLLPGPCDPPYGGNSDERFFAADASQPIRHARLRQVLYLRRGPVAGARKD